MSTQWPANVVKDPEHLGQAEQQMQEVLLRSTTDMEFRQKLLTEPRSAIAEFNGKDVSELPELNVQFIENRGDATIVLPDPVAPEAELSADELETVAGGIAVVSALGVIASALAVYDAWFD